MEYILEMLSGVLYADRLAQERTKYLLALLELN